MDCQEFSRVFAKMLPYLLGSFSARRLRKVKYQKKIRALLRHQKTCFSCRMIVNEVDAIAQEKLLERDLELFLLFFALKKKIGESDVAKMVRKRFNSRSIYRPVRDDLEAELKVFMADQGISKKKLRELLLRWLEKNFPQ